jgi:acylphosphatase
MVRYLVRGRVQGVGFRWFVMREASRLKLRGHVRNLPDGDVEVCAEGSGAALSALEQALARGPAGARVEHVEKEELSHEIGQLKSFDIM